MSKSTFEVVRDVLVNVRGVDPAQVVLDASLTDDLGADSLDAIEVIMALEAYYDKELDDEGLENLKTVGDVVALVDSLVS